MKKFVKTLSLALLAGIVMCSCSGNRQDQANAKLEKGIKEMQKDLPMIISPMMKMTDISYKGDVVKVTYALVDQLFSPFQKAKQDAEVLKRAFSTNLGTMDDSALTLFHLIIEAKNDFEATITNQSREDNIQVRFTSDELDRIINQKGDPKELAYEFLEAQRDLMNLQVPWTIDFVTTMVKVELTDTEFRYYYDINDTAADMDAMSMNAKIIKENIKTNLSNSPEAQVLLKNAQTAGIAVIYIYQGTTTGKTVKINIMED